MACRECGDLLAGNCYCYQMKSGKKEIPKQYYETICKPCKLLHTSVRARLQKLHPYPADSKCQLCGRIDRLVIDHCHVMAHTDWKKSFRGWICGPHCNAGLGLLGDSAAGLRLALQYLENFETGNASSPERTGGAVEN